MRTFFLYRLHSTADQPVRRVCFPSTNSHRLFERLICLTAPSSTFWPKKVLIWLIWTSKTKILTWETEFWLIRTSNTEIWTNLTLKPIFWIKKDKFWLENQNLDLKNTKFWPKQPKFWQIWPLNQNFDEKNHLFNRIWTNSDLDNENFD